MPKVTLTVDQILEAAGIEDQTGQHNIRVADFVKVSFPAEIVVSVSPDQIALDPASEESDKEGASESETDSEAPTEASSAGSDSSDENPPSSDASSETDTESDPTPAAEESGS